MAVVSITTEMRGVMQLSTRESLGRWFAGALAALLAAGVFAPATARAGCTHDALSRHAALAGDSTGLELLNVPAAAGEPSVPLERPKPCSGVFCSGNPGLPGLPATTVIPRANDWGMLFAPPPSPVAGSFSRHHDGDRPRPIHDGQDVFHPPRRPTGC
jgi:hypothetical protein